MRGPPGRGASRWARATRPVRFFKNHETRNTAIYVSRRGATAAPPTQVLGHESRNTAFSDTAFPHRARQPGPTNAAVKQPPHRLPRFWVTNHETRDTNHGLFPTRPFSAPHPSRRKATAAPPPGVLGHESRDTRHETRLFIGLFPIEQGNQAQQMPP